MARFRTHGMSGTPIYECWHHMKQRCNGTTNKNANKNYHDRGIGYDPRWNKFESFYEDMSEGYSKGLDLDRIDNNKGYSKENCRWISRKQNSRNKRNSIYFVVDGMKKHIKELCEEYGVPYATAIKRMTHYGKTKIEHIFHKGNLLEDFKDTKPILPCVTCGNAGGTLRTDGSVIRKLGMCNTCYQRYFQRKRRSALAADMNEQANG